MQIASVTAADHADFLALVDAEIRPDRAKTNAWDDFPLILAAENRSWQLVARDADGEIAAGLACLIRTYVTSCGDLPVAGIGSVVTRPRDRGRGLSSRLQNEMLSRLRRKNIPLAVLWTDQPAIYAGRGFTAAGWEVHADLTDARLPLEPPTGHVVRPYRTDDAPAAADLYAAHRLRTRRLSGDTGRLYGMPGTRGLILADTAEDRPVAAVFCSKGADFVDYVAEWLGPARDVLPLLGEAVVRRWARHVLIPAGGEALAAELGRRGAGCRAQPSGFWAVLAPGPLVTAARAAGRAAPDDLDSPVAWLGTVDPQQRPVAGIIDIAVWGMDSV